MANLSITNVCNRECGYCFARDTRAEYGKTHIDNKTYEKALDYLQRSGIKQARLLGGEPTLHPEFIDIVKKALDRKLEIMLFSNGLMPGKILNFLADIPEGQLSVLLNTIHPDEADKQGILHQKKVMKKLGRRIIPGINICNPKQELDYLPEYIAEYNLKKEIRLGLSHPALGHSNIFLHPKEYKKVGYFISQFKHKALKAGISLGFDCGFVPCMFPDESIKLLSEELKKAGNCCHPIIDMLTDGSFIACYPLNNLLKIKIHDRLTASDLIKTFREMSSPFENTGIFPYCTSCPLFRTRCNGGCLAYRIRRYSEGPLTSGIISATNKTSNQVSL